ncbi:MAG: VCBS repeat-containing protein, partial [Gemmatimonadota bacterium]|nr:VCBS repeat-containing protein [Gemmatimonadota bacterium]
MDRSTLPKFVDATATADIHFAHVNGGSGRFYYVETYGSGAAFVDYDSDGDEDLYLVNGAVLPGFLERRVPKNILYRNKGNGKFEDITEGAGVGDEGYGMGVCAGDYNNDGHIDLYVTNFGANVLYRNGGGSFVDATETAGIGDERLSMSAAFADIDNDGDLDLYVSNNTDFTLENHKECRHGSIRVYCGPGQYKGASGIMYRNEGDETFTDVTEAMGVYNDRCRQLGVVFGDYDEDGDVDLFVANDMTPNFLFRNEGGTRFSNIGLDSGVAFSPDGKSEAGMGTDFGDYDRDGLLDIVVCNFQWEHCRLLKNERGSVFKDQIHESKLDEPTFSTLTFGTDFFDYDNDGYLDLFLANGHVEPNIEIIDRAGPSYAQRDQLFHNNKDGTFTDISADSPGLATAWVGRGSATADYDNDGDLDLLSCEDEGLQPLAYGGGQFHPQSPIDEPGGAALVADFNGDGRVDIWTGGRALHNQSKGGNWIEIAAQGLNSNRDGVGAKVEVKTTHRLQKREIRSEGYAGVLHF